MSGLDPRGARPSREKGPSRGGENADEGEQDNEPTPLVLAAAQCGAILEDTRNWLHRRVDHVSFPAHTATVRWRFSVDFRIPEGMPPFDCEPDADGQYAYYVPIALLRKWKPLSNFDLRDEDGRALPLLTASKNREIDGHALEALAPLPAEGRSKRQEQQAELLHAIARADPATAREYMNHLYKTVPAIERRAWTRTFTVASALVNNSLLWVFLRGNESDRRIVKAAFDDQMRLYLNPRRRFLAGMGWGPTRFWLAIPNLGQRDSYHMEVEPPKGMEIHQLRLWLDKAAPDPRHFESRNLGRKAELAWSWALGMHQLRHSAALRWRYLKRFAGEEASAEPQTPEPRRPDVTRTEGLHGHVYLGRSRDQYGLVELDLAVPSRSLANRALALSAIIAVLLSGFTLAAGLGGVNERAIEGWVTMLLLVPALLAYVIVRPGEHPLLRQQLTGVRLLALLAGALPILAAVVLLIADPHTEKVTPYWLVLALVGWVTTAALTISWLLPHTRSGVPDHRHGPVMPQGLRAITDLEDD